MGRAEGPPPFLVIESADDAVLSLPWELLRLGGEWSVRDGRLDVARCVPNPHAARLEPPTAPVSIRVNVCAPEGPDLPALSYEKESFRISLAMRDHPGVRVNEMGELEDLLQVLCAKDPPAVIHFSGHGGRGALHFEDEFGADRRVPVHDLITLARQKGVQRWPRLFHLSCCHGQTPAHDCHVHGDLHFENVRVNPAEAGLGLHWLIDPKEFDRGDYVYDLAKLLTSLTGHAHADIGEHEKGNPRLKWTAAGENRIDFNCILTKRQVQGSQEGLAAVEVLARDVAPRLENAGASGDDAAAKAAALRMKQRLSLALARHFFSAVRPLRSEWRHNPFGADLVGDRVIACGARDAKANLLGAVQAGEAARGARVLLLLEGEEKGESPRLLDFVRRALGGRLPVGFLCADGGGYTNRNEPTMELGLKGQLALEIEFGAGTTGVPPTSIHSGHATLAVNPNDLLARFLASLKDAAGRVTLDGFYASVRPPERPYREPLADGEASFLQTLFARYGYSLRPGETPADIFNRLMFQPELNVASVRSGETGLETRIAPARASARLDINLVPGQEPEQVLAAVQGRLREHGIEADRALRLLGARSAYRCPPEDPFAVAAHEALAEAHPGKPAIALPSSGSSGPVSGLPRTFGRPLVRLGTGSRSIRQPWKRSCAGMQAAWAEASRRSCGR